MSGQPRSEFVLVRRDELWFVGARPEVVERRLLHGRAEQAGSVIEASDAPDQELLAACDEELRRTLAVLPQLPGARVRVVCNAQREDGSMRIVTTINLAMATLSLISAPAHVRVDYERLMALITNEAGREISYRGVPVLWLGGSASVLLHEAAGHAAEHRQPPIEWPVWLSVHDEPSQGLDDSGRACGSSDLLAGQVPRAVRRDSFTDVPRRRMSSLVARQQDAPFDAPRRRIEIHLLSGGRYEPLTEMVTLFVSSARLVDGDDSEVLAPFTITESRRAVAASIIGAAGAAQRYPGVVCSSEGQELVVGSCAPDLLTEFP